MSRDILEGFFNLSLDLLCIADLQGHFVLVNPEWKNVLGYSQEELNGHSFLDFVHPDDLAATLEAMKDLQEGREVTGFENRYRAQDGGYRWIQWRSKAEGQFVYAAARDITGSKEQFFALQRLSGLFQKTNEVARVGGWEVDLVEGKVWWSDVTRQIHECEPSYFPNLEEGINFYLEGEDRDTIRREFTRAVEEGIPFDLELRIVTAKGRVCWIRTVGQPVFQDDRVVQVAGAFQDIDERRKAFARLQNEETKLRGLFDLADVGIAMNDLASGHFIMFNQKLLEATGYTRAEFEKLSYWQLSPPEYAPAEQIALQQLRETGRYGPFEKEYCRKDGTRYPVRLSGFLMREVDGRDVIWSIVQDITKEKETENALRDAALKAEEANRAKSTFLATMSHEIRTPLNGVIGGTELLNTTSLSEEQASYVRMILQSGELLLSTINDVLDYSKIESGRIDLECAPFDVVELVDGLVNALTPQVRQKGLELTCFASPGVPRQLMGDAVRLRQVLLNLLSNAIKFTGTGSVKLSLLPEADRSILFQVEDTGIGIPPARLTEIFQPFVQAESSTTRQFGGTGLGLSISHRLVALMGGELQVRSMPQQGTCFFFRLALPVVAGN
jgi:PAS domain S-box-containing protein